MLKNASFLAIVAIYTAEIEPSEVDFAVGSWGGLGGLSAAQGAPGIFLESPGATNRSGARLQKFPASS